MTGQRDPVGMARQGSLSATELGLALSAFCSLKKEMSSSNSGIVARSQSAIVHCKGYWRVVSSDERYAIFVVMPIAVVLDEIEYHVEQWSLAVMR